MLGTIQHAFSNAIADGTNTQIVRPSDWNSAHNVTLSLQSNDYPLFSAGGTTGYLSSVVFSNSNGVSFGLNGNTITATVATNYQAQGAYLTTARASTDAVGLATAQTNVTWTVNSAGISFNAGGYNGTGFTSTSTNGTDVKATNNTSGLSMAVPAYITTARASTDAVGLNTAQTNVTWTVNSSGISFNAAGYNGTGFTSTSTAGSDIKATNNTSGLSMAIPAFLTVQTNQSEGMYALGNTTGQSSSTTYDARTMSIAGAGGISVGYSSNSGLIISGPVAQTNQTEGMYALGNTVGQSSSTTYDARTMSIAGAGAISVGYSSNSGLIISAPAQVTLSRWEPMSLSLIASSFAPASWNFHPFVLPSAVAVNVVYVAKSINVGVPGATSQASTGTARFSYSHGLTLFTRQDFGANSTNLSQFTTASFGLTAGLSYSSTSQSFVVSWVTNSTGGTTSFNTTSNAAGWSNFISAGAGIPKVFGIPMITTLTAGEYWLAQAHSSTSGTTGSNVTLLSVSMVQGPAPYAAWQFGMISSSAAVSSLAPGYGGFGVASAVTTNATMAMSVVSLVGAGGGAPASPYFNLNGLPLIQ